MTKKKKKKKKKTMLQVMGTTLNNVRVVNGERAV